jgi:hypothetical protein
MIKYGALKACASVGTRKLLSHRGAVCDRYRRDCALGTVSRIAGAQAGEVEIKEALQKVLFKYKLYADEGLFEKSYSYIWQYYCGNLGTD